MISVGDGWTGCVTVDDAFVEQNQNLLLQISKRTTFFLWYVCFNAFQKEYLRRNIETQSFFWVCWPTLLYTKHHGDWITCLDRDGREIAVSTEERSSSVKKTGYIVRTRLKSSTPIFHSVKSEPSKSSCAYVLLSTIQRFWTEMNSQGGKKVRR